MLIFKCFFIFTLIHAWGENRPPWVEHARNLIGESSNVRGEALKKLGEIFPTFKDLEAELDGEHRHYALDVAVAMKYSDATEKLLRRIDKDRDGSITLAVNALLDKGNFEIIAQSYDRFLQERQLTTVPTAVVVAMTDFFTHLRRPLVGPLYLALLTHPRLEVQQAAALYFAVVGAPDKLPLIDEKRPLLHPQVRGQLLLTHYEMKDLVRTAQICTEDKDPIVQSACEGLRYRPPGKEKKKSKPAKKKKAGKK